MDYIHIHPSEPIKLIWRLIQSVRLHSKRIRISPFAHWNGGTVMEGHNMIHTGANIGSSHIGKYTYINRDCYLPKCKIGRFCSIANDVKIINYKHPTSGFVSTSPAFYSTVGQCVDYFVEENTFTERSLIDGWSAIIGNDVWIGVGVRILEGVKIGDGAIIATGALVTKDVPPFTIVGGIPAKEIKKRFSEEHTAMLQELKWWEKDDAWLKQHVGDFQNIETLYSKYGK